MPSHAHSHDDPQSLRPKAARLDPVPVAAPAAYDGRPETLEATLLGLQRAAGNSAVTTLVEDERSPVHDVVGSGGGSPLAPDVRGEMEARLGSDFSDVRVHTDSAAHNSAVSVNAHAYTVGSNVVFQRNMYDPTSHAGRTTLAHELTHVTQQRAGEVDGAPAAGGIRLSDPSDRFERAAAENADRVMSAPLPAAPVQRAAGDEADSIQRAEMSEEEIGPDTGG